MCFLRGFCVLLLIFIGITSVRCDGDDDLLQINKLRNNLMKVRKYNRNARPVKRHTTVTEVAFTMFIRKIVDVDIQTAVMTTYSTLYMEWIDEHLVWNPSEYGGIDDMTFDFWELWTPDIRCWSVADGAAMSRSVGKEPIRVLSNGAVQWWTRAVFKASCDLDLSDFPFDQQECSMGFLSWSYDIRQLNLTVHKKYPKHIYGPFQKNPEWAVLKKEVFPNDMNVSAAGLWASITVSFTLERRNQIYLFKTGLPYVTASLAGIASFLTPIGSGRRYFFSGLSIIMLALIMISLGIQLGPHSVKVPYAVKCVGINMTCVGVALVLTTLIKVSIERLSQTAILLPRYIINFLDSPWLKMVLFMSVDVGRDATRAESRDGENLTSGHAIFGGRCIAQREWILLAQFIDRICFLLYIMTTIIYHS